MLVLYKKLSKQQKKFTEHKDYYFALSVVHFGSMFSGGLGISDNQVVSFSMSCRIAGDIGFWWNVGSNLYTIYCISKDVIKSLGVPDRQFLEYNYKLSQNKFHDNQFLQLTPR